MKNLEKLQHEKLRLKAEIADREKNLNERLNYLEEHFGRMTLNSVLPFDDQQRENINGSLDKFNNFLFKLMPGTVDEEKQDKYKGMLQSAQMLVAGLAFKYLKKFF